MKTEGVFVLRYRVFDLYGSPKEHVDRTMRAECFGGPFRVYSTKDFPGLQASTDLTKVRDLASLNSVFLAKARKQASGSVGCTAEYS